MQELAYTPVWIFDITMKPGGKVTQELPQGWNAFAYTLQGDTTFGHEGDHRTVSKYHNVVFEQKGDSVRAEVAKGAKEDGQFSEQSPFHPSYCAMCELINATVLVAGLPLDQKIVQYGPFVLNSQEEVYQAMLDYQSHSNGFERAAGWRSEIGKSMVH